MLFICCLLAFSRNVVEANKQPQQKKPLNNPPNQLTKKGKNDM